MFSLAYACSNYFSYRQDIKSPWSGTHHQNTETAFFKNTGGHNQHRISPCLYVGMLCITRQATCKRCHNINPLIKYITYLNVLYSLFLLAKCPTLQWIWNSTNISEQLFFFSVIFSMLAWRHNSNAENINKKKVTGNADICTITQSQWANTVGTENGRHNIK